MDWGPEAGDRDVTRRLGEGALWAAVAAPLVAWPGFGEEALRPLWVTVSGLALSLAVLRSVVRWRMKPSHLPPLLLVAVAFAALRVLGLFFARNPWEGLLPAAVTVAGVTLCSALANGYFPRRYVQHSVLYLFPLVALLLAGVGLYQRFRLDMGVYGIVSTLGNSTRTGAVAAMLVPVCGALLFVRRELWARVLAVAGFGGALALVILSESRGGLLAAAMGCGASLLLLVLRKDLRWMALVVLLAGVAVPLLARSGRLGTVADPAHETNRARLLIWKGAAKIGLHHPIVGTGAGGFRFVYPEYRSEEEFRLHTHDLREFREVEDPHNLLLQLWSEGGAPLLLAFLWVLYVLARIGFYYTRNSADAAHAAPLAGLLGGVTAFLVAGMAMSVERFAALGTLFWLMAGMIAALGRGFEKQRLVPATDTPIAFGLLRSILLGAGAFYAFTAVRAESEFIAAQREPDRELRLARFQEAEARRAHHWRHLAGLGRELRQRGRWREALAPLVEAAELHPYHVLARDDRAQTLAQLGSVEAAEEEYTKILRFAPFYAYARFNRGILRRDRGDGAGVSEDARGLLELALRFAEDDRVPVAREIARMAVSLDGTLEREKGVAELLRGNP